MGLCLAACTAKIEGPGTGALGAPGAGGSASAAGGSAASSGAPGAGTGTTSTATDPGRVTLHRLNRVEYDNTVRDLLGTALRPAENFPIDDRGGGFDNMADVLTLSPLHLSVYASAAKALVSEVLSSPAQRAKVVTCDLEAQGEACAREILSAFAYRAWRRPPSDGELERLLSAVAVARAHQDSFEVGLALALRAVLLSPHFIFRVELDPDPTSAVPHALGGFELASRLSYFLWSSMPDEALLSSAAAGRLGAPDELRQQATRLMLDPRASALIDNFAGQWLHLRSIASVQPDPAKFPGVDEALLGAMKGEAELAFRDIAFNGAPLEQLLVTSSTYLNDRLAAHYGLPAVGSSELKKVELAGNLQRGGLLSQAGFLALTSHPERTSPVKRGKWVMDELLCATVPAPPGNVDLGAVAMAEKEGLSQRQALERHRQDPTCNACHKLMDPIGLGLENYDAVGAYRTMDAGSVIDSAGELPTGERFSGARELSGLIAKSPDFARCAASKLYTYALGRTPVSEPAHLDESTLERITSEFAASGYAWNQLVASIVVSPTFTQRRGEPVGGQP
jgi:hypothetical protein